MNLFLLADANVKLFLFMAKFYSNFFLEKYPANLNYMNYIPRYPLFLHTKRDRKIITFYLTHQTFFGVLFFSITKRLIASLLFFKNNLFINHRPGSV